MHRWCGLTIALAFAGIAPIARAQDPVEYRALIDEAIREWGEGHWDEARAMFRAAHAIEPSARTLRGIGMASFELRDYPEAYRTLGASLVETRNPLDEVQRADVTALLSRIEARIGRYRFVDHPQDAAFEIDGSQVAITDGEKVCLALGNHSIRMRGGSRETWRIVTVYGGEDDAISFAPEAALAPVDEPSATADATVDAPPSPRARYAAITLLSSGAAGVVLGSVLLGIGVHDRNRVLDAREGTEWASLARADERSPKLLASGLGFTAIGLAGLAAGTTFALRGRHGRPDRGTTTVSISPQYLGIGGTF